MDQAVVENLPTKLDMWDELHFNVFFKGDDWRGTPKGLRLEQEFQRKGVEVVYFPYTMSTSSTARRRTLAHLETSSNPAGRTTSTR